MAVTTQSDPKKPDPFDLKKVEQKTNLEKWFNIKPSEEGITASLLMHSFFMGLCMVFFETASYALFLTIFDVKNELPYVYIISSLVATGAGFLYDKMDEKYSLFKLLGITVGFITFSIIGLYFAFQLTGGGWFNIEYLKSGHKWVIMAMTIWYTVLHIIFNLEFWGLAGHMLDVRQGKRLFGFIGAGEIFASIIGGVGINLMVDKHIVSTPSLLLVAATSAALCLFMLLYINLNFTDKGKKTEAEEFGERPGTVSKISKLYLYLVFSFAVLSIIIFYAVDYVFYDQIEIHYKDEAELTGFLGIFAAVMGVLNLLSNTLAAGKLMTRYGQTLGLLSVPVSVIGCCFIATFFNNMPVQFLWIIVLLKLTDEVVRNTIGEPAIRILYQPYPPNERMQIQTRLEGMLEPAAGAVSGILLLGVGAAKLEDIHLVYVMIFVSGLWIFISLWLRQEYTKVWASAVTKRRRSMDGSVLFREDGSRESVIEGLNSPQPGKVIYCLNVLEEVEHEHFNQYMVELLSHDHPDVRVHVLDKIRQRVMLNLTQQVHKLLEIEEDPKVKGTALQTLCKLAETEAYEQVFPYLENEDVDIRKGALIGLLRDSGIEGVMVAGAKINSLLDSHNPEDRKLAAFVLGEVGHSSFYRPLLQLLKDNDMEVRAVAINASGKLKNAKLIPMLLENLAISQIRSSVVPAIIAYGEMILPALEEAFDEEEKYRNVRSRIVRIIGRIGGEQAIATLKRKIDFAEETLRNLILNALVICKYQADETERHVIQDKISHEVKDAAWTLSVLLDIGDYKNAEKLVEALRNEFRKNRQKVYLLLAMIYPTDTIVSAQRDIESKVKDKVSGALEAMDNLLNSNKELKNIVFPLIDDTSLAQCRSRLIAYFPQERLSPHERIKEILGRSQKFISAWTKCCALLTIGRIATGEFYDTIISSMADQDPTVRETSVWALGALNPNDLAERLQSLTHDKDKQVADYANFVINSVGFASIPMSKGYLTRSGKYNVDLFKNILMDEGERRARRCRAANILSRFHATSAKVALIGGLMITDKTVRTAALDALVKGRFDIDDKEAEVLLTMLRAEITDSRRILKSILTLMPEEHSQRLVHALNQEINYNRKRALSIISLLNRDQDKESLNTIFYWYIYQENNPVPPQVRGKLQYLLNAISDADTRQHTFTLFQYRDLRSLNRISKSRLISHTRKSVEHTLKTIAFSDTVYALSWSRICAIEMIVKMEMTDCVDDIIRKLEDPDDIVRSMAAWALFKMDLEEYKKVARQLRNDASPLVSKTAKQLESELPEGFDQEKRNDTNAADD